jgi:hypothetical protein
MADVTINDQGTIVSFTLNSDAAKDFVEEYVRVESYLEFPGGFHADHRMAQAIIEGMTNDGLTVD